MVRIVAILIGNSDEHKHGKTHIGWQGYAARDENPFLVGLAEDCYHAGLFTAGPAEAEKLGRADRQAFAKKRTTASVLRR